MHNKRFCRKRILSQALDTTLATKRDIERLEAKIEKTNWMVGVVIAIAIANFAKQFF